MGVTSVLGSTVGLAGVSAHWGPVPPHTPVSLLTPTPNLEAGGGIPHLSTEEPSGRAGHCGCHLVAARARPAMGDPLPPGKDVSVTPGLWRPVASSTQLRFQGKR